MNENMQDFDGINFYREDPMSVNITGFKLENPGMKKEGSSMGDLYDIILFSDVVKGVSNLPERFQAILISPIDYVENMIENGFLGMLVRCTNTSDEFMDDVFKKTIKYIEECNKQFEENTK